MHKQNSSEALVFAGIDVSARELVIAVQVGDTLEPVRNFANTTAGHRQLQRYLHSHGRRIRVCLSKDKKRIVQLGYRSGGPAGPAQVSALVVQIFGYLIFAST